MAEEDLDFGDDDLEMDDNSGDSGDSGDDFAGELDDVMGDDELGGKEAGSSDSDSELDSFFEDLSSIEDMDEGGSDEGGAEEADFSPPDAEPSEAPAPAKKEKPKKEKKEKKEKTESGGGGGKLKFIIPVILLLLVGAGGAYWFLVRTPVTAPPIPVAEEPKPAPKIAMPAEQPIKIEQPVQQILPEPEIPLPAAKPAPPQRSYLIQVAKCSYDACKEEYINALREEGEPVFQKAEGEKYDFIELISRQVYSQEHAQSLVNAINRQNQMAGNASIKNQSNGYRVTMGTFPALDRAKEIKFHIEKMFPKKDLTFNLEHVRKNYASTKIYAGPYDSSDEAKRVLQQLRKKARYRGAFLVRTTDPI